MTELANLLQPGDRVFVAGSSNEPSGLLQALRESDLPEGLHFIQFPVPGFNSVDFTSWHPSFHQTTFFMTPALRGADPERLHFVPIQMRHVYEYVGQHTDVALLQFAAGADGALRVGPNVDFAEPAMNGARVVIGELNRAVAAPAGGLQVDAGRIAALHETERTLFSPEPTEIDAASREIGAHVASGIQDGDCLQTGIGAIPAAILDALGEHNDLGLHGGLIDDGGMRLIEKGVINGASKTLDRGRHVTGMALGSAALYQWLANRPDVEFRGANYTHEVGVIRQLDGFISINSAVEVDLFGQVNAEFAGGRQISGTGGSVDFMRGARASRGGRSVVALPATARGGSVSRIVARVDLVTASRTDVDLVVTEFGVADLRDQPLEVRRERLIEVASPDFREALREPVHA